MSPPSASQTSTKAPCPSDEASLRDVCWRICDAGVQTGRHDQRRYSLLLLKLLTASTNVRWSSIDVARVWAAHWSEGETQFEEVLVSKPQKLDRCLQASVRGTPIHQEDRKPCPHTVWGIWSTWGEPRKIQGGSLKPEASGFSTHRPLMLRFHIIKPWIRKSRGSTENANTEKKIVISKLTLTYISLQKIWTQNISCFLWLT